MFLKRYAHLFRWLFIVDGMPSSGKLAFILQRLPCASIVILRSYEHPQRKNLAFWLSGKCKKLRLLFLVAGDPLMALAVGASGLHVREIDFCKMKKWQYLSHGRWFISAASHSVKKNHQIQTARFNAALFSPVFKSKDPNFKAMGPTAFRRYCSLTPRIGVFALGGTSKANIWQLRQAKQKAGIAGISLYNHNL